MIFEQDAIGGAEYRSSGLTSHHSAVRKIGQPICVRHCDESAVV